MIVIDGLFMVVIEFLEFKLIFVINKGILDLIKYDWLFEMCVLK